MNESECLVYADIKNLPQFSAKDVGSYICGSDEGTDRGLQ